MKAPYIDIPQISSVLITTHKKCCCCNTAPQRYYTSYFAGMRQSPTHYSKAPEAIKEYYRYTYMDSKHRTRCEGVYCLNASLEEYPQRFVVLLDTCVFYDQGEELFTRLNMVLDGRPQLISCTYMVVLMMIIVKFTRL